MRYGIHLIFLLALRAAAFGGRAPDASPYIDGELKVDGRTRNYHVVLPAFYSSREKFPLILGLHGGGGEAKQFDRSTNLGRMASSAGFIVVFPNAVSNNWNDGRPERSAEIDDVKFFDSLLEKLLITYSIDAARIFSTGISNGGLMSYRLACERALKIKAIAPVAANLGEVLAQSCYPAREVSLINFQGTADNLVPFAGGEITGPFGHRKFGTVISSDKTLEFFVSRNKCSAAPARERTDTLLSDRTVSVREVYAGCAQNSQVVRYVLEGGGHTWPGNPDMLPEALVGVTSMEVSATATIIKFFQDLK